MAGRHLVIDFPRLAGGGAERPYLNLLPFFLRSGLRVTILVDRHESELSDVTQPAGVEFETVDASWTITVLPRLVAFLRTRHPEIVLSEMSQNNVGLLMARLFARRSAWRNIGVVLAQHNTLSARAKRSLT
jgi:hypothetical protein